MKLIINPFRDCHHNIASEEFIADNLKGEVFLLYINSPSIIIGRNQNTYSEINHKYVEENNIQLVRRISGGGAVYHDLNNLNFSFIMDKTDKSPSELFKQFTAPVIKALNNLGVNAVFSGRNDLTVDEKKFSGNAQFHRKGRMAIHGTILFDTDLSVLGKALQVNEVKYIDRGIDSVRSRVTNIKPYMNEEFTMDEFVQKIIENVEQQFETFEEYKYTDDDLKKIDELVEQKYGNDSWNFGKSPKFEFTTKFKFEKGLVEININAKSGIINEAKIYGDFFGIKSDISDVEKLLLGVEFKPSTMKNALSQIKFSNYIDGLTSDDFIDYIFDDYR